MAFIKLRLDPINTRAADATFDFEEPYIQTGIISGQSYTSAQVAGGLPKPSYLQIAANSAVVTVVGSGDAPLRIVFPLGLHDANTGGEIGAWRSFTSKTVANNTVTVSVSEKAWIYAEINENGEPNNVNAWTVDYGHEIAVGKSYTTSTTQPGSPVDGDIWFDVLNNNLYKYNSSLAQFELKKRVYLGEAGVGDNGYIYTIQSWFPNREYANYQDSFYPVYYENPWRFFDGVSFLTNGLYTAAEAANWANNATIAQSVAGNQIAMNAVANSATALDETKIAANSINAFGNSAIALTSLGANSTFTDGFANSNIVATSYANNSNAVITLANNVTWMNSIASSSVAMTSFANSAIAMAPIANSSIAMSTIANSSIAMSAIANSAIAQGAIVSGTQNTSFLTALANNTINLDILSGGSAGNILFTLIGTNSTYQTLVANAQGQLVSLANLSIGPILALGGNTVAEITDGGVDYRVHTFTASGTFDIRSVGEQANVQYLVVAGGGGGGNGGGGSAGGGGAGGVRHGTFTLATNSFTITVGAGGAKAPTFNSSSSSGANSSISGTPISESPAGAGSNKFESYGGGGGASSSAPGTQALSGGSGGGGGASGPSGAAGNIPSTSPSQGNSGGNNGGQQGGGGGGAGAVGGNGNPTTTGTGNGGNGFLSTITGSPGVTYGGGGGGGAGDSSANDGMTGGAGGGGNGQRRNDGNPALGSVGTVAPANLGGGGGGFSGGNPPAIAGHGNGGSGIVIVRYPIEKV